MLRTLINRIFALLLVFCFFYGTLALAEIEEVQKMYFEMFSSAGDGKLDEVEVLLKQGVDPNWNKSPFNIIPMLHRPLKCISLDGNKVAVMKMLLEAGANPNVIAKHGDSTLIRLGYCKKNGIETIEIADLLLGHGADPKYINKDGTSAFTKAVDFGNEALSIFLAEYSDITEGNIKRAMSRPLPALISLLIKNGLDLSQYPIMEWAIRGGHDDALIDLLESGVSPNEFIIPNRNYDYPIIYAAHFGKNSAVEILHKHGADLSVEGRKERTLKSIVSKLKNTELGEWLNSLN